MCTDCEKIIDLIQYKTHFCNKKHAFTKAMVHILYNSIKIWNKTGLKYNTDPIYMNNKWICENELTRFVFSLGHGRKSFLHRYIYRKNISVWSILEDRTVHSTLPKKTANTPNYYFGLNSVCPFNLCRCRGQENRGKIGFPVNQIGSRAVFRLFQPIRLGDGGFPFSLSPL